MGRRILKAPDTDGFRPSIASDRKIQTDLTLKQFFDLHPKFIKYKALEGLCSRTLKDHEKHLGHFKKYLVADNRFKLDRWIDTDLFRGYISYMIQEKNFKPCTINVRLRTLKCYLKWLFDEGHIDFNYSTKLKLVKVPVDTIKPLTDKDTKKMLKTPDRSTFSGYRDFCLMVLMLDCGVSVGEAICIKVSDVDPKHGLVNVRPETAKTRSFRQLPISLKCQTFRFSSQGMISRYNKFPRGICWKCAECYG